MTKYASEMELYIIIATLENFECWNFRLRNVIISSKATSVLSSNVFPKKKQVFFNILSAALKKK